MNGKHHRRTLLAGTAGVLVLGLGVAVTAAKAQKGPVMELDPAKFDQSSTNINNDWWPLKPGIRLTYEGYTIDDGKKIPHKITDTTTDLVKVINGVRTLVALEMDFSNGRMIEKEIAFHAQDKEGNVWHFGQLREVYDVDELVGYRAWNVDSPKGAKAGIRMPAKPALGTPDYSQGYAPAPFNWTDRARVSQMGQSTKVRTGAYKDVMVIDEWDDESPKGAFQTKWYARGVGIVRIGFKGPDKSKEEMELVKIEQLTPEQMAEARAQAIGIDTRAFEYGRMAPVAPMAAAEGAKK